MNTTFFIVYQMTYRPTGQFYIGSTSDKKKRWERHRYEMRKKSHHNHNVNVLLKAGYIEEDWNFEVLSEHDTEQEAKKAEETLIKQNIRSRLCLNVGRHACGGDNITRHPHKKEIISKRTQTQIKNMEAMSEEERKLKWGKSGKENPMYGKKHTAQSKKAVSDANKGCSRNKGIKRSESTKKKLSEIASKRVGEKNPFYGKKHSQQTIEKISAAKKGSKPTNMRKVLIEKNIYESVRHAAKEIGVSPSLVIYRIKSKKWDYHYL